MKRSALLSALTAGILLLSASPAALASPKDPKDEARDIKDRGQSQYLAPDTSGGLSAASYPSGCGVRVDLPHPSYYTHYQIHTNVNSTCYEVPVISSSLRGNKYRMRWYGWQGLTLLEPKSRTVSGTTASKYNWTAMVNCTNGDWYRYRTEGFGSIQTPHGVYGAAAYQQNDSEIQCQY